MTTPNTSARPDDGPHAGLWLAIVILSALVVAISVAFGCREADLTVLASCKAAGVAFFTSAAFGFAIRTFLRR